MNKVWYFGGSKRAVIQAPKKKKRGANTMAETLVSSSLYAVKRCTKTCTICACREALAGPARKRTGRNSFALSWMRGKHISQGGYINMSARKASSDEPPSCSASA